MQLLPFGAQTDGEISIAGHSILGLKKVALRNFRLHDVAMIYQDPRAHIYPLRTVGDFLLEGINASLRLKGTAARDLAGHTLREVGIRDAASRMCQYPHELSGGLLQRVMIASALLSSPRLLLADEPTTALDVTTQSEVMAIIDELRRARSLAMLFITHDLDLAAAVTDNLAVMYAGRIVEIGPSKNMHCDALHPYTVALMAARPSIDEVRKLVTIPGRPIAAYEAGDGCVFASRCPFTQELCRTVIPKPVSIGAHIVSCHRAQELHDGSLRAEKSYR